MHKLYELKNMLCEELEEYGSKGKLDVGSLDVVDKLAHAIKNIDKIIEAKDEGSYAYAYDNGRGMRDNSYTSYARRDSMGRYSRRDGYSRDENEFRMELKELIEDAPNERIKMKMKEVMSEM